jgi:hypothetical protein
MDAEVEMSEMPEHFEQESGSFEPGFGILMAPVNGKGTWSALKELRKGLSDLRPQGSPKVLFVDALDGEGKAVSLQDSGVVALVLGYTLSTS